MPQAALLRRLSRPYRGLPPSVYIQVVCSFINNVGGISKLFLPLYLRESYQLPYNQIGMLMAFYGAGMLAGSLKGGSLTDRFDSRALGVLALAVSGLCMVLLALRIPVWLFMPVLVLSGMADGGFRPINQRLALEPCAPQQRPVAQGMMRVAFNLGVAIAGVSSGFLAAYGYQWVYAANAAGTMLGACWMAWSYAAAWKAPVRRGAGPMMKTLWPALARRELSAQHPGAGADHAGLRPDVRHAGAVPARTLPTGAAMGRLPVHPQRPDGGGAADSDQPAYPALGAGAQHPAGRAADRLLLPVAERRPRRAVGGADDGDADLRRAVAVAQLCPTGDAPLRGQAARQLPGTLQRGMERKNAGRAGAGHGALWPVRRANAMVAVRAGRLPGRGHPARRAESHARPAAQRAKARQRGSKP
ncbi:enterobactin exporter EntS [Chromobacterium violaceum]|uniref:Enterobactin exporter EntS n=1 Tax=Chromobacterium violaceum TaxID=536 RepID=A0A3S4HQG4_CHRVL|nr:enterobactin exporter EntS [Chromobacterium violaceum]